MMFHELGGEQMRGVGRSSMPKHRRSTDDEAGASLWGCGVPTAPQGAKLTYGRLAIGSGFEHGLPNAPAAGRVLFSQGDRQAGARLFGDPSDAR